MYALESTPLLSPTSFVVASDNRLLVVDLAHPTPMPTAASSSSIAFATLNPATSFGGDRNPDKRAFVFDCQPTPESAGLAAAAVTLSDASLRLVDLSTMQEIFATPLLPTDMPAPQPHCTNVSWGPNGLSLLVALSNGKVLVVDLKEKKVCVSDSVTVTVDAGVAPVLLLLTESPLTTNGIHYSPIIKIIIGESYFGRSQ